MKAEIRRYEDSYDVVVSGRTRPATRRRRGGGLGRPHRVAHDTAESRCRPSRTRLRRGQSPARCMSGDDRAASSDRSISRRSSGFVISGSNLSPWSMKRRTMTSSHPQNSGSRSATASATPPARGSIFSGANWGCIRFTTSIVTTSTGASIATRIHTHPRSTSIRHPRPRRRRPPSRPVST